MLLSGLMLRHLAVSPPAPKWRCFKNFSNPALVSLRKSQTSTSCMSCLCRSSPDGDSKKHSVQDGSDVAAGIVGGGDTATVPPTADRVARRSSTNALEVCRPLARTVGIPLKLICSNLRFRAPANRQVRTTHLQDRVDHDLLMRISQRGMTFSSGETQQNT